MEKAIFLAGLSWLIPGAGYWLLRKPVQGILVFLTVTSLVILGVSSGGLYYPGNAADYGLMYWLQVVSSAGNAFYVIADFLFKTTALEDVSAAFRSALFEYGGRSLALAGLLNYLSVLHIFDCFNQRKQ